jgi:TonB family protein
MPEMHPSRPEFSGRALLPVAFLLLTSLSTVAQESPSASPSDPAAFMLRAAEANGLSQTGGQPWHLKVSFKILDQLGNANDQGTVEEFYVSPTKFKRIFASSGYSHTVYGTGNGLMYSGDQAGPSPVLRPIRDAFVRPVLAITANTQQSLTSEQRTFDGASHFCITMSRPSVAGQPARPIGTYCFDPATRFLQTNIYEAIATSLIRSHPFTFQGRWLPGDLEVQSAGKVGFTAHLEAIEPITTIDEAFFVPPPDATTQEIFNLAVKGAPIGMSGPYPTGANGPLAISGGVAQGLLVQKTPVEYPAVAKAARVQGTVILQGRIATDGTIAELKVISGPLMLQQAAIDAVQHWVYRPYILNGKPVEVQTTVNVIFTLGGPAKEENPNP